MNRLITVTDVDSKVTGYNYDNEDILLEYDGAMLQARYTHGPGIDEPLIMDRGGVSHFYHADGLGSITDLTDATGTVAQTYVYNSFGEIVEQVGSLTNPYTYTGREFDEESGLYFYRARYYDPSIGRFLSEDPFPGYLALPQSQNPYPYATNNPVNFIDPLGLWTLFGGVSGRTGAQGVGNAAFTEGVIFGTSTESGRRNGLASEAFFSTETGENVVGAEVGGELLVGFFTGNIEDFGGPSASLNVSLGPLSISIFTNPNGNVGLSLGIGTGVNVGSSSATLVNTTISCR